jgi:hypothetical protein
VSTTELREEVTGEYAESPENEWWAPVATSEFRKGVLRGKTDQKQTPLRGQRGAPSYSPLESSLIMAVSSIAEN